MTVPNPSPSSGPGQDGQPAVPENKAPEGQEAVDGQAPSPMAGLAADYAAKAGLHRTHDGRVDVLRSAGGVQGIAESILPGLVFLVAYTVSRDLTVSLVAALAAAAVFTVVRLVQRRPLTQALAGVVGVGISAWLANTTGKAEDFYLPGFFTNAAYIVAMVISILVKWPVAGLLFGFIRNEGLDWRKDPARLKAYRLGTWIIVAVLVLRLVVQVPLYLLGPEGLAALATTRLIMGTPLYILGIWAAWLITRPAPPGIDGEDGAAPTDATSRD
ncbi:MULTISPECIES: DUF3159 domain-containing protein [Micrococcaceae]|uniref:DUF3159 domain-containing protein n=1 Tax=Pseudarthrobacter siccitolerans TaxID=861266 RepID=A0ABU0PF29_9MICC|nr:MULTISPECIES: DUF3159 domain-containing protein [Micrococcaceae]MDQ0672560.1 hypothetical protein [Pseudarthrobacter siccitolerans]MDQ0691546.1 hypothetical protein [Arthrobacter sp. W4I7]